MKIIPLVCPKCGGAINVTNKGSGVYQCPYCDTPIYFDDDVKREEKKVDINIKSDTIDRTEIQKNRDNNRYNIQLMVVPFILWMICMILIGFGIWLTS